MAGSTADNLIGKWERLHRLGYERQLLGEWDAARNYYEQALIAKPGYAASQLALAQLRMMQSGFREGRELYEMRFAAWERADDTADWRGLPFARWQGEPLKGKHLHLWAEQGFGDVIMVAGFLPYFLAQEPSRITLSMFPKMISLFARSFPQVVVESLQDIGAYALSPTILDSFPQLLNMVQATGMQIDLEPMRQDYDRALSRGKPDYCAPMGDLMVYGLPDFVPSQHPLYMVADPVRVAETKNRLQRFGAGYRIGISWHTANKESGSVRSIPLPELLPLLHMPECRFFSLQHHVSLAEIESFCGENGCRIQADMPDVVQDTEGLAALTASMDEIITIDNSNVHLAGALGVPATLLLPKGYDFRWPVLHGDHDTLWYKSVSVKRQEEAFNWCGVIEKVTMELENRLKQRQQYGG